MCVLSKVCEICKQASKLKKDPQKYQEWERQHKASGECQKNFNGSNAAMEKEAAKILWGRSIKKHGLQYILTWFVMGTAKLIMRSGTVMVFVMTVQNLRKWTKNLNNINHGLNVMIMKDGKNYMLRAQLTVSV